MFKNSFFFPHIASASQRIITERCLGNYLQFILRDLSIPYIQSVCKVQKYVVLLYEMVHAAIYHYAWQR